MIVNILYMVGKCIFAVSPIIQTYTSKQMLHKHIKSVHEHL